MNPILTQLTVYSTFSKEIEARKHMLGQLLSCVEEMELDFWATKGGLSTQTRIGETRETYRRGTIYLHSSCSCLNI